MTKHESKRLIASFLDLSIDTQQGVSRFLVGAKLGEIVEAKAHGVTEIEISYFKHGLAHRLVWDDTTRKLLGATEPLVIDAVIANLSPAGQLAVREGGETIRNLKIKHKDTDDREYLHVHYVNDEGYLSQQKLELDGRPKEAA